MECYLCCRFVLLPIYPVCTGRVSNEALLLTARCGVRQAVAVLAHVARPAAFYWRRCSRTQGVMRIEARMDASSGATGALYMISIYFQGD
jgi:hypothetical protein